MLVFIYVHMNTLLMLGIILFFAGILLIFLSSLTALKEAKTGGVVLIGPLPIVFGSDKETVLIAIIGAIILMIIAFIFFLYLH